MDHDWVHRVRCSLLGLETGVPPSKKDIDTSEHFVPQAAASELEPPEVIMDHWLPILQEQGLLAECHPNQFTAAVDWVPSSLTAMVPPEFCVGTDKEFLLTNFHWHECLVRQSISISGRCRQLAFCPYCGVINENSETALSHLDLLFVCGGCYSKSFPHGQALNKHMRTQCCSVLAIREKTRASRK